MKKISEMTLKEKLGQLVMCGFEDPFYDEHARILIEDYKVGNIILFKRNVENMKQVIELNKTIYNKVLENTGIMPFISIDQEGGMVTRIMDGATFCPGTMTISASDDKKNAYNIGRIMGVELTKLGINLNLAPSLDVNNNPNNPVIGIRSYSDDPKRVSEFGNQFIKGLQEEKIFATAKHFPGHGDTNVDSHLGLATLNFDRNRLDNIELVPFKSAIKNGVKAIMSAHIIFKAIDDVPATLSDKVLTNLLREELGFEGLIVSDCMQMKAIDNLYTTEQGTVRGIKAGLNIACVCHSLDRQINTLKALEDAIKNGIIPMEVIDERVERILKYKEEIQEHMLEEFYNKDNDELAEFFNHIEDNKKEAQRISDEALTLYRGVPYIYNKKTLVIGNVPFASTIAEDKLNNKNLLQLLKESTDLDVLEVDVNPENIDEIVDKAKKYEKVIYVAYNINSNLNQGKLADALNNNVKELYIISSRNPYDILHLKNIKNIVCLYEYSVLSIQTMLKYIKGEIKPNGVLPVDIDRRLPIGASIYLGLKDYSLEDNLAYLKLLKEKKISYVFLSAQMEEANDSFYKELKTVIDYANENKIKLIVDVNKKELRTLKDKKLLNKIDIIRLDYGFSYEEILNMQKEDFLIELNASTVNDKLLKYLKDNNADFSRYRVSHNFYPKPYTGLSFERVKEKNEMFKKYGFTVMMWIPTISHRRLPLYRGLPTIEEQRDNNIMANISECILAKADNVFFGDAFATEEELDAAINNSKDILNIPIIVKKGISKEEKMQLERIHINRTDYSDYMIRSSIRCENIKEFNCVKRMKKDITIDNVNYKRYQGEVGIVLKEMPKDDGVNVVARCVCNDALIDNIKGDQRFKFVIIGEE